MESKAASQSIPVAMTIAGSDSGGQAGVQADLKTFAANQVHGISALTCLTAQSPSTVADARSVSTESLKAQIKIGLDSYKPSAIKTGMLFDGERAKVVVDCLNELESRPPIVVDPVMIASSGSVLLEPEALDIVQSQLLPLATLITPNLDEAETLGQRSARTRSEIECLAKDMAQAYDAAILIKGGHLDSDELIDTLALPNMEIAVYTQTRIRNIDTHGSGCTLSAAIAAWLAKGFTIESSVKKALDYLRAAMESPISIEGNFFINHFP